MHKMLKARQNDGGEGEWHKEKDMSEWERERERQRDAKNRVQKAFKIITRNKKKSPTIPKMSDRGGT